VKSAEVKVTVVSSVPLTPTAPWVGASFTEVTTTWTSLRGVGTEELAPPLAVPPSSVTETTVILALPFMLAAGVKVNPPVALIAGCTEKRAVLSVVTTKESVWLDSSEGPALSVVKNVPLV